MDSDLKSSGTLDRARVIQQTQSLPIDERPAFGKGMRQWLGDTVANLKQYVVSRQPLSGETMVVTFSGNQIMPL